MNRLFVAFFLLGYSWCAYLTLSQDVNAMSLFTEAVLNSATQAVTLAIQLVGTMTFFLGLVKVVERGGLLTIISRGLRPILIRLFPQVPAEHPAMGAMVMNLSANVLGLGNAATPFGIKAMQSLNTLNHRPGVASDAMILFLAINTSSVTLLPTGVIALRQAVGSSYPEAILPTTLFATLCSTTTAIILAKLCQRYWRDGQPLSAPPSENTWRSYLALGFIMATISSIMVLFLCHGAVLAPWLLPTVVMGFLLFGWFKKVPVYEAFTAGAKEGFQIAINIIPYLVAILAAVGVLRASGVLDAFIQGVSPFMHYLGFPPEALPMAILRPLSGSGAYAVLASTLNDPNIGPDSFVGYLVSTIQGSTETTFYVLAVYFGAVQIKNIRYALWVGLLADLAGVIGAFWAVKWLLF